MIKRVLYERRGLSLAAMLALCLAPLMASADFAKTNPVTGETENYTWKFVGTDTWNGTGYWQDSDGGNPSKVPHRAYTEQEGGNSVWDPILFDAGENAISINASMAVEGWNLRMGLYNGATITLNNLQKFQGDAVTWFTVDETSQLTIATMVSDKLEGSNPLCLYSARANGITWTPALANSAIGTGVQKPIHYYLSGDGTVAFNGGITLTSAQVIKQADVTLSEATSSKTVRSKMLVSFASTSTSTFSADAETTIKVKNSDGSALKDVNLTSVTATDATLTTAGNVGDCELVQTSTGILLYYVDYAKTTYKPSININFTSGTALSTGADVGIGDYAVPGTSWNNLIGNNGSLSALNATDSSGATFATAASVTISGTRGYWTRSGLDAASDLRQGYIDDADGNAAPQFVVTGIPYYKYQLVLYFSNDTDGRPFGHLTINGTNYKWDSTNKEIVTCTGTSADVWGSSDGTAYTEGGNYLVFPALNNTDGTLTVIGHRWSGTQRAGLAAVQIVEVKADVGENDLEIAVNGDTNYSVSETKDLTGTVYLTGNGTLTLDGSAKITASTIDVGLNVTLVVNADRLDATTFVGSGTVVYNGSQPVAGKGWADADNWVGTVWVKNVGSSGSLAALGHTADSTDTNPVNEWGNANSFVKFTNVYGYMSGANCPWTLILEDDGDNKAWYNNNGWSGRQITIGGLKGSGTFNDAGNKKCRQNLVFTDATAFTGSIHVEGKRIGLGGTPTVSGDSETLAGVIEVVTGATATLASGQTWNAGYRIAVNGTLTDNGTMESGNTSAAISGSGTVVFDGKTPSPTGNAWWKNAAWTGIVEIKNHTLPNNWLLSNYGNSGSKVRLDGVNGPIKYGTDSTTHNIKELIIASGGYTHTGTYSSGTVSFTVPCKITGSGTYKIQSGGAAQKTTYFTGDMSEFGGTLAFGDDYSRFVIGSTETPFTAKSIVVGDGAVAKISNPSEWYPAGGVVIDKGGVLDVATGEGYIDTSAGIVVNGTVKAKSLRTIWGGISASTPITINSTGILELTSSENTNDSSFGTNPTSLDLSKVTGTGTIKYSSTAGWRAFPDQDARMPASTVGIQVEVVDSLIISKNNGETVIGSLSGSKNIRSDFGDNGANGRILTVTQSKDTEWQGKFVSNRLTQFNVVAPAEGAPGTLTLSGTQEATIPMQVDGSVNLTGTWKGATTVSGTFGGTGSIDGSLTFSDGATFMATNTPLTVSGDINVPATGVVTVDVSQVTFDADTITILQNSNGIENIGSFKLVGDVPEEYALKEKYGALVLTNSSGGDIPEPAGDQQVRFWVENNVAHADVNVYTNGVLLNSVGVEYGCNIYYPNGGTDVTIVYSAQEGYVIIGKTRYSVEQVTDDLAFPLDPEDIADMSVKSVDELTKVAFVTDSDGVNTLYETLNGAFEDVVESDESVTLIHDAELTNTVSLTFPVVVAGYNCKMGGPLTLDSGSSLTMKEGVAITNVIAVTDYNVTVTYPTALAEDAPTVTPPEGYDAVVTDNEDGTSTISFKVHEEPPDPPPPTPTGGGYEDWQQEHGITGEWDEETDGVPNVFRYVFDKPEGELQLITNITFNADSHAVIWTPQPVNDLDDPSEFSVTVVASDDFTFGEGDTSVPLSSDGATEIVEDLQEARFFRLKAEKKPQE